MNCRKCLSRSAALLAAALSLAGCSIGEEKRFEYRNSQSIAPLQIPTGMASPESSERLQLPQTNPEAAEVDVRPPVNLPEAAAEQTQ